MDVEYPKWLQILHVLSTKSSLIVIGLSMPALLLLPLGFIIIGIVFAVLVGLYFVFSGTFLFEANQKYVLWLGKKRTDMMTSNPTKLVIDVCQKSGVSNISPVRTRENPYWYSPKRLKGLAESFLEYPPEVTFHLVNRVLPTLDSLQVGIQTSTSGLAADLMMTFERMFALNSEKAVHAANFLAYSLMTFPNLRRSRETLWAIGQIESASEVLREEMAVTDTEMRTWVVRALHKLDPTMAQIIAKGVLY